VRRLVEHLIHRNHYFCKDFEGKTINYLILAEGKAGVLLCYFLSRSTFQRVLSSLFSIFSANSY